MKQVIIYTDGACSGNPGPGGWGAVLKYGAHERELSGGEASTTNNRMELTAVIEALRLFAKLGLCTVSMGVMYALIIFVFKLPAVVQEFSESATWLLWATAAMGLLLFFVYDLLIDRLAVVYRRRRGKKA